ALSVAELKQDPPVHGVSGFQVENVSHAARGIVVIHKLARRAEGRTVRDPVALVDGGPVHRFVETIKRSARRFFLIVHRSGPETPAPVDLAVVETIARKLFFRPCDDLEPARVWIESSNAFVRPGDKAAALSRDNGSDPKRRRPSAKFA